MVMNVVKGFFIVFLCIGLFSFSGCSRLGNVLNPFQEELPPVAFAGQPNDHALREGGMKQEKARQALESVARYPRAHAPQPQNPVIQPAVVRLMWVPDHLNTSGDLVPAHYYYLKVKSDDWAVQDAFELETQLKRSSGEPTSNLPYVID